MSGFHYNVIIASRIYSCLEYYVHYEHEAYIFSVTTFFIPVYQLT